MLVKFISVDRVEMKNMSRIFTCDPPEDCKPWKAPSFEAVEDSDVDYHLPTGLISNQEKQQSVRQQAFEKAFAKGYMEGLEKGQNEIRQQADHLRSILATLAMPIKGFDDQIADELMHVCMAVVRQMVRRELKISPGEVVAVIKDALRLLPDSSGDVRLELHPEDAVLVRTAFGDLDQETNWRIVEDPLLSRGGCKVVTNSSRIDATVETRINAAIANVMGSERQEADES